MAESLAESLAESSAETWQRAWQRAWSQAESELSFSKNLCLVVVSSSASFSTSRRLSLPSVAAFRSLLSLVTDLSFFLTLPPSFPLNFHPSLLSTLRFHRFHTLVSLQAGGSNEKYEWTQTATEIEVKFYLRGPRKATKSSVSVAITRGSLSVGVMGDGDLEEVLTEGELFEEVEKEDCGWLIDTDR